MFYFVGINCVFLYSKIQEKWRKKEEWHFWKSGKKRPKTKPRSQRPKSLIRSSPPCAPLVDFWKLPAAATHLLEEEFSREHELRSLLHFPRPMMSPSKSPGQSVTVPRRNQVPITSITARPRVSRSSRTFLHSPKEKSPTRLPFGEMVRHSCTCPKANK